MDEDPWCKDKLKAFYERASKSEDSLNISHDKLLQCWKYLQRVTSVNWLTPSSVCLDGLLSNASAQSFCLEEPACWSRFGAALLTLPSVNDASPALAKLVDRIVDSGSQSHTELLEKIWIKRGEVKLPVRTLEQIILMCPQFLEASLRDLLLTENNSLTAKSVWSNPKNTAIIRLASESADIFQGATSIMNEILIRSGLNTTIINLIQTFIKGTKSVFKSNLAGFISLYPDKYQTLIMFLLLQKHKPLEAIESVVSDKLYQLMKDDFKAFVCLATHFPVSSQSFQNLQGAPHLPIKLAHL